MSLLAVLSIPPTKAPLNVATFASYVLPPVVCYFIMAVLAITPQTRVLRVACWLVLVLLAWRAAFSVDVALSSFERKFHNDLANLMLMVVTRALYWALAREPLVREHRPVKSTPSKLVDALDLALAFRGCGWGWSRGLYVPPETRPSDRVGFVVHTALSAAIHAFICGTMHRALRSFSPAGLGSISGGSIFDDTLPWHMRYLRSSVITLVGTCAVYALLQMVYDLCTLVGIILLGQHLAQWPPGFDAPWRATSLAQFWGRRWHQWLRHMFLVQGGYPLSLVFGRAGLVVGAFLSSAVYHHIGMNSLDSTSESWRMILGFGMMALGIFAEQAFRWLAGRKVCGLAGWAWTMAWLILWANVIMDGFVRAGLFRAGAFIDSVPVLRSSVERLVADFDTWFHAA